MKTNGFLKFRNSSGNEISITDVDGTLNATSDNPVKNKTVKAAIEQLRQLINSGGGGSANVTYGVKIDLTDSDPSTAVEYTDDAVALSPAYMDFANDTFVDNGWKDRWPFSQIKPCLLNTDGTVACYLNPDNYEQDVDGNTADITDIAATGKNAMVEFPKIYYKISRDTDYIYIQISNHAQDGFCCNAFKYKGVEKDKRYTGIYDAYNNNSKNRSVSGVSPTGSVSLNNWQVYAQANGEGFQEFNWFEMILLQCLYLIMFRHLDSQAVLGYGVANGSKINTGAGDTKGMYYGSSGNGVMKFCGIENWYGNLNTWVDGLITDSSSPYKIKVIDVDSESCSFDSTRANYKESGATFASNISGYISDVFGDSNDIGFCPKATSGSATTRYCDSGLLGGGGYVPSFGGSFGGATSAGAFYCYISGAPTNAYSYRGGRLSFL